MPAVADALALLGCSAAEYTEAKGFGDDFRAAWDGCGSGRFVAWFLRRIGFDWERVAAVPMDALEDERLQKDATKFVGGFRTPEAAHNLVHFLCDVLEGLAGLKCCSDSDTAVADAYRGAFDFDEVQAKLLEAL